MSYDIFSASALAGNTVTRRYEYTLPIPPAFIKLGGVMPLCGPKMYTRLGPNWAATAVGLTTVALIPIPWGFYKWGKKVRMRSPMLLKLQKEKEEIGDSD
jgi:hypothetical protein